MQRETALDLQALGLSRTSSDPVPKESSSIFKSYFTALSREHRVVESSVVIVPFYGNTKGNANLINAVVFPSRKILFAHNLILPSQQ